MTAVEQTNREPVGRAGTSHTFYSCSAIPTIYREVGSYRLKLHFSNPTCQSDRREGFYSRAFVLLQRQSFRHSRWGEQSTWLYLVPSDRSLLLFSDPCYPRSSAA